MQNVATPLLQFDLNHEDIINKEKVERYGLPLSIFGKVNIKKKLKIKNNEKFSLLLK